MEFTRRQYKNDTFAANADAIIFASAFAFPHHTLSPA